MVIAIRVGIRIAKMATVNSSSSEHILTAFNFLLLAVYPFGYLQLAALISGFFLKYCTGWHLNGELMRVIIIECGAFLV